MPKRLTDRDRLYRSVSEADFQDQVIELAQRLGYKVMGMRKSSREIGGKWVSNLLGDGKGWPDLFLAHPEGSGQAVAIELKREGEKPTEEQKAWGATLIRCGIIWLLATPSKIDSLTTKLQIHANDRPRRLMVENYYTYTASDSITSPSTTSNSNVFTLFPTPRFLKATQKPRQKAKR
jgi:hypothetical protein